MTVDITKHGAVCFKACLTFLLMCIGAYSYGQSCDCPAIETCGICEGGLISLTIKYTGGDLLNSITATDGEGNSLATSGGTELTVFSNDYPNQPFAGGQITVTAYSILLVPVSSETINTSCSTPIYEGAQYGDFVILGGESLSGGTLCCSEAAMESTPPIISNCPTDINVTTSSTQCQAIVSWSEPGATDDCGNVTLTADYASGTNFPIGTTLVTYTATDDYGNTATCSFNVTVQDVTGPSVTCPANQTISADAGCKAVLPDYTGATTSDNCSAAVTVTQSPVAGTALSLGATTVTLTATDGAGNISTCSFDINVKDDTAPSITCPANQTISADAGCKAVLPDYSGAATSDNCSAPITVTQSPVAGTALSLGATTVTLTAIDGAGNTATCSFDVIIEDGVAPVFAGCPPSDITVETVDASCQARVTWTAPSASDNCGLSEVSSDYSSGDSFPVGITVVTYTAIDNNGNTSICSFDVEVKESSPPVFSGCPADISTTTASAGSCEVAVNWIPPTTDDDCSIVTVSSTHNPGDLFGAGITEVVYTATDEYGNTTTCSFNVEVVDNIDPTISNCTNGVIIEFLADDSCDAVATWSEPTASDNCNVILTSNYKSGDTFPLGTTTVEYKAIDDAGNMTICTFKVMVKDKTDPIITGCPAGNITSTAEATECGSYVFWTAPIATDNCTVTLTSTHSPGQFFNVGTTPVTYTATDNSGRTVSCSFNVIVNDVNAPILTGCPSGIELIADDDCSVVANWAEPAVEDNCPASLSSTHEPGSSFSVGITTVTYTAVDPSGNKTSCSFDVIVKDMTPPFIEGLPATDVRVQANDACEAEVSWAVPTASDNCSAGVQAVGDKNPGEIFVLGRHTVTYTATDEAGNSSSASFDIIVEDATPPQIMGCIADIYRSADDACKAIVDWTAPSVSDNCGAANLESTHNPGQSFDLGRTTVTYTATDAAGNTSTCVFNVIVTDATSPQITSCPSDIIKSTEAGSCGATVHWPLPTATDNCPVKWTNSHNPGDFFDLGEETVTYTAIDASGNESICTFKVTIDDNTLPVISGYPSTPIEATTSDNTCEAVVSWPDFSVTDNCSAELTFSHPSGSKFPLGSTSVTCTAKDPSGNTSQVYFEVNVKDGTPPSIEGLPSKDIVKAANESCQAIIDWAMPTATDCSGAVDLTGDKDPGSLLDLGRHTVTYTATDEAGNSTSRSFDVVVKDLTGPEFSGCIPSDIIVEMDENCQAVANWEIPSAVDKCGSVGSITGSHNPGDFFSEGVTEVVYTATDNHGNSTECRFNVVVVDRIPPVITECPVDIEARAGDRGEMAVDWIPPFVEDCGGVVLKSSYEPGSIFSIGTTEVVYTATDASGNSISCRFSVNVTYDEVIQSRVVTPDGDGINEGWILTNIEKFKNNEVVIVDRWGSIVYRASGYDNNVVMWKGENLNGGYVPTGTYFYTLSIKFADKKIEKQGFIEVIR